MSNSSNSHLKDLKGTSELAVDAVHAVTDIVESTHLAISSLGGILGPPNQQRTRGIPGLVYGNIRLLTTLIGKCLEVPLGLIESNATHREPTLFRESIVSALNGALGDYLLARGNPLAITMQLRQGGQSLSVEQFKYTVSKSKGRILLLVHGSSMSDLQWQKAGHNHGAAIADELGMVPVYLHYNSGLHISTNGQLLAQLLEAYLGDLDNPIELSVIAYSMGGLVSRSAHYYSELYQLTWTKYLKNLIFLGTPHHGALLERSANWGEQLLKMTPYSAPFAKISRIRSQGITDLRYGNILDEDWQGRDRFSLTEDHRTPLPLPNSVRSYAIAGITRSQSSLVGDHLIGDGLVTVNSALGQHTDMRFRLEFPSDQVSVFLKTSHFDLLNSPKVFKLLRDWLKN